MSRRRDFTRARWENRYMIFVGEAPETFGQWSPAPPKKPLPFKKLDWKIGDRVRHKTHGLGIVLRRKHGSHVRVRFKYAVRAFTYWEALEQLAKL